MLNRNGKVLLVTGPTASSDGRLHRAQALALDNGVGLEICRVLIDAKLRGQEQVIRERLNVPASAEVIDSFRKSLPAADTFEAIRQRESHRLPKSILRRSTTSILWPKADLALIPEHWRTAGSRQSPLTGAPRLAVTPVHAILNYCFSLLEAETPMATFLAVGLRPAAWRWDCTPTVRNETRWFSMCLSRCAPRLRAGCSTGFRGKDYAVRISLRHLRATVGCDLVFAQD